MGRKLAWGLIGVLCASLVALGCRHDAPREVEHLNESYEDGHFTGGADMSGWEVVLTETQLARELGDEAASQDRGYWAFARDALLNGIWLVSETPEPRAILWDIDRHRVVEVLPLGLPPSDRNTSWRVQSLTVDVNGDIWAAYINAEEAGYFDGRSLPESFHHRVAVHYRTGQQRQSFQAVFSSDPLATIEDIVALPEGDLALCWGWDYANGERLWIEVRRPDGEVRWTRRRSSEPGFGLMGPDLAQTGLLVDHGYARGGKAGIVVTHFDTATGQTRSYEPVQGRAFIGSDRRGHLYTLDWWYNREQGSHRVLRSDRRGVVVGRCTVPEDVIGEGYGWCTVGQDGDVLLQSLNAQRELVFWRLSSVPVEEASH